MPSPKSGQSGSPVSPADPKEAQAADTAVPGEVERIQSTPCKSHKKPKTQEEKEKKISWIEIELVDEDNNPVPGEQYLVTLPDETVEEGSLDENGFARIDGFEPGTCKVTFPNLDKDTWRSS